MMKFLLVVLAIQYVFILLYRLANKERKTIAQEEEKAYDTDRCLHPSACNIR